MAKVLLVDDDAENRWSLQLALESDGHHVSVASDALRALEILRLEPIQFIITDFEMPGVDGAEFSRLVRAHPAYCEMPVLMLSAAPEPRHLPQSWTRFLRKPARFEDLLAIIDAYVAVRLPHAPHLSPAASIRAVLRCQSPCACAGRPWTSRAGPDRRPAQREPLRCGPGCAAGK